MLSRRSPRFEPTPVELPSRGSDPAAARRRQRIASTAVTLAALVLTGAVLQQTVQEDLAAGAVAATGVLQGAAVRLEALMAPSALELELAQLRAENTELAYEVSRLQRAARERDRLLAVLDLDGALPAHVVGTSTAPGGALRLDLGGEHGVAPGQAVVGAHGVIGTISDAHAATSQVMLLTDTRHALQVETAEGTLRATARGTGAALAIQHVLPTWDVKVDDVLYSTGLGGVFPAGTPVAVVTSVTADPDSPFLAIDARPLAPPASAHEVLVMVDAVATEVL